MVSTISAASSCLSSPFLTEPFPFLSGHGYTLLLAPTGDFRVNSFSLLRLMVTVVPAEAVTEDEEEVALDAFSAAADDGVFISLTHFAHYVLTEF